MTYKGPERRSALLTDDDIRRLADILEKRMLKDFYFHFGKGVWGFVWRGTLAVLLGIAAYGYLGFKNNIP